MCPVWPVFLHIYCFQQSQAVRMLLRQCYLIDPPGFFFFFSFWECCFIGLNCLLTTMAWRCDICCQTLKIEMVGILSWETDQHTTEISRKKNSVYCENVHFWNEMTCKNWSPSGYNIRVQTGRLALRGQRPGGNIGVIVPSSWQPGHTQGLLTTWWLLSTCELCLSLSYDLIQPS